MNRKEKRRKKFDVENNPDKFWKLSKNNFILKEEVGGKKTKHPVHRAYLHPEFLRPKYLIAAAMAKYLPFVGIGKDSICSCAVSNFENSRSKIDTSTTYFPRK